MAKDVIFIHWSLATQIQKYARKEMDGDPLWISRLNATNPEAVSSAYMDYLRAGAQIFITNTYQASVDGYMKHLNLSRDESIELLKKPVRLAHEVRDKYLKETNDTEIPQIFGVVGPYGAHLNDGSEYTGSYAKTIKKETLIDFYKIHLDIVLDAGVDGIIFPTMPCQIEAETIVELVQECYPNLKYWISFSAKSESEISSGEKFSDVVESVWGKATNGNMLAIGVNCLPPIYITSLFTSVNGDRDKSKRIPLTVSPNSGEKYTSEKGWHDKESCIPIENFVEEWINLGVKFLGLCCRTNEDDYRRVKNKVESLKNVE